MKQTAVEWLIEQILDYPLEDSTNVAHLKKHVNKVTVFEKAKELEKQQIQDAYLDGYCETAEDSQDYYSKTYSK